MTTHTFGLDFHDDSKSDLHHNAQSLIVLKSFSKLKSGPDADIVLTPICVTYKEIEHQIDELIAELNHLKSVARSKYAKDDKRFEAMT